jgi:hypothetical protein
MDLNVALHRPALVGRMFRATSCALLLLVAFSSGCSRASPFRAIERSVRDEMPRVIGPADRYEVVVSRSGGGLVAGRIPWINIRGQNVRAIEGLTIDDLEVRLEDVRFSRSSRTVQEIGLTHFEARLSAGSVVGYLHSRSPGLRGVQVAFDGASVRVHATPSLLGIGVPMEVEGRPLLRGPTTIDFAASRIAILRLGLPEFAVRRLEARINPLVDLSTMPLPLHLTSVQIMDDRALITGTASLDPARLRR